MSQLLNTHRLVHPRSVGAGKSQDIASDYEYQTGILLYLERLLLGMDWSQDHWLISRGDVQRHRHH